MIPDSEARHILGSAYKAQESKTMNAKLRRMREFHDGDKKYLMLKHLGIGVAHDDSKTIRVHFETDPDNERILIGWCGPHLPIR